MSIDEVLSMVQRPGSCLPVKGLVRKAMF